MNSEWQGFLQSRHATIDGEQAHFARASGPRLVFDLSHLGLLGVRGEEAEKFLQGQLTNDIRAVTPDHSSLAGHCSPKGRMLALFRLLRRGDDYLLQLPRSELAAIQKRLQMFVLIAKVTLRDLSDELVRIGLEGDCEAALGRFFPVLPPAANAVVHHDGLSLIRLAGARPRFELIGPPEAVRAVWEAVDATPSSADHWALLDIRAGTPSVLPENREAFVPQMANLQLVDGVSFTKGCYTGQEVVARMQYLGKLKRRMYLAHVAGEVAPRPGDELYAGGSTSGQGAGRVVDAAPADNGGYDLLAVIEIASAEGDTLRLGADGPALELRPLPYTFEKPQGSSTGG